MELARWSIGRWSLVRTLAFDPPSRAVDARTRAIVHTRPLPTRTLRAMRVPWSPWKNARAAALALSLASRVVRVLLYIRHKVRLSYHRPYSVYSMLAIIRSAPRRLCSPGGHSMLGWAPGLRHGEKKSGRKQRALPWCLQYRGHGCACRQVVYEGHHLPSPMSFLECP